MADEERQDETQPEPTEEEVSEETIEQPDEAVKALRERLKRTQRRLKAATLTRLDMEGIAAQVQQLTALVGRVLEQSQSGVSAEDVQKAAEGVRRVTEARKRIGSLMTEADVEWDDPRLERVRELWSSGNYEDAVTAAEEALQPQPNLEDLVAAEVSKRLRQVGKVDTGGSTAVGQRITIDEFRKMSPSDRLRFKREHPDEYKKLAEQVR